MPIDTSERDFEDAVVQALTEAPEAERAADPAVAYRAGTSGSDEARSYRQRPSSDFSRERLLIPDDVHEFILATQPKTWKRLKQHYGDRAKERFIQRLSREVERRGTLNVLRRGFKDHGCAFEMAYFRPRTSLNPDLRKKHRANVFTVVRQLVYDDAGHALDLALFLNGLPLFTAELKDPLEGQTFEDAVAQYKADRAPRNPLFAFRRCLAHFAVDTDEVWMTTELEGEETTFLPFNKGYDGGAGNPPRLDARGRDDFKTAYLWGAVWSPESVLNLVRNFIHTIEKLDDDGEPTGEMALIFPRYQQLRSVRRLVADARAEGAGERYLVQHSAGSGKSISIAVLAHQLAFLHHDDEPVFDTVVVITDRCVLDEQIAQVILQFEQARGVVANVTEGADELRAALEHGKKVVVTTLQKFPYVSEEIKQSEDRRFAVLIDEAHSSQTGEYRKHLHASLSVESLEEAEEADALEEADLEDKIMAAIRQRGPQANVSDFAFTATPKSKTLEQFGTQRERDGRYVPFDLYSMRQAIEEGFILDVLENYTTYRDYFRLHKQIEDDPRFETKKATRLLKEHVTAHEATIRAKVEIMAEHFAEHVAGRIDGQAKAMIVTRSRLHAVRYHRALDRYLNEQGYPYGALVAFSGTVEDDGLEYTERSMNNGLPARQTAQAFRRDENRFLVVANKYQTGFDEPLLAAMYVDKKLGGVGAVQTLSRLNRTHPGKEECFVLDFANDAEEIQSAFQPYYEKTILREGTNPNLLHDLEHELAEFGFYASDELEAFAALWFGEGGTQKDLLALLGTVTERYEAASEDDQAAFRRKLGRFVRLYAFLSQVISFADRDLEILYEFGRLLLVRLPIDRTELPRDLLQHVDLSRFDVHETHSGSLSLRQGTEPLDAQAQGGGGVQTGPPSEEPLSEILRVLNEHFDYDFSEDDERFIEQLEENIAESDAMRRSAEVNPPEEARFTFDEVADEKLQGMIDSNFDLYRAITDNDDFARLLFDHLFDRYLEDAGA